MIKILEKIEKDLKDNTGIMIGFSSEVKASSCPTIMINYKQTNLDSLDIVSGKKKKLFVSLSFSALGSGRLFVSEVMEANDKILDCLADSEAYQFNLSDAMYYCEIVKKGITSSGSFDEDGTSYNSEYEFEIEYVKN